MTTPATPAVWPPEVTLERDGVRLEPLTLAHEAGLAAAAADGELWNIRVTSVPEPQETRGYIETALKQRAEGSRLAFAVIDVAANGGKGKVIGSTSYHDVVPAIKRVEIGWTWYAKSYQRSKVNTLCKLMLMQHAFETLGCAVVGWRASHMNFASQRAIERLGAKRDGVLRHHAPIRDGKVRDTVMYSMLASEWPDAKARLQGRLANSNAQNGGPQRGDVVSLVEINAANLVSVADLDPGAIGSRMVATNALSISQGAHSAGAWLRAVYVRDTPVGLVMLLDPAKDAHAARQREVPLDSLYVWRLMIDFQQQGKGFGAQVMQRVIELARSIPDVNSITVRYALEDGSAKPFYARFGFEETGRVRLGEMEMQLSVR